MADTSRIELMINRRIFNIDGEINEFLDENGTYGLGNQVRANF